MNRIENIIQQYRDSGIEEAINYENYLNLIITSHSTRIEGSTLSIVEAQILIENNITPKKRIEYSMMTLDHYNAFKFVMKEAEKRTPVSVELIQKIASKVMEHTGSILTSALGTTDASKGEFRKVGVMAGNTRFMDYKKVPQKVRELVSKLNADMGKAESIEEQLKISFFAHYELVNIHPFIDGNGRTARLLMNYIQRLYSLPLALVYDEDKNEYYNALIAVREQEDIQPFYDFMFDQYEKFLSAEVQKVKEANNSFSANFDNVY